MEGVILPLSQTMELTLTTIGQVIQVRSLAFLDFLECSWNLAILYANKKLLFIHCTYAAVAAAVSEDFGLFYFSFFQGLTAHFFGMLQVFAIQ